MNIKRIKLKNFLLHKDTDIEFPDSGIVVVTGPNGFGKSTIVDAVYYALTGKTLKGTPARTFGENTCSVTIETDVAVITRKEKGSSKSITWHVPGQAPVSYETNTKASEALWRLVDPSIWLRLSVFYKDMVSFGSSTDSDRKKFLERVLGIDHYDAAYRLCLADNNTAGKRLQAIESEIAVLTERVRQWRSRIEELSNQSFCDTTEDTTELQDKYDKLTARSRDIEQRISDLNNTVLALNRQSASSKTLVHVERNKLDKLRSMSVCPTCEQSIPEFLVDSAAEAVQKAESEMAVALDAIGDKLDAANADISRLREQLDTIDGQREGIARQQYAIKAAADQAARLSKAVESAKASLQEAEETLVNRLGMSIDIGEDKAKLDAVADVLGPKGFRAKVLSSALAGLAASANTVLASLGGSVTDDQIRVTLLPFTESKAGNVSDTISLEITGAGGGHGYKALSDGQKRRIDIALLLAPAMMSEMSGTLFMDEVFDALDVGGVDKVVDVLGDLASSRCVVVITHNPELASKIPAAVRFVATGNGLKEE